ncbi:MAG: hypothetical protein DCF19_11320 [Pseudanabaena frigida]|uniref:Uncharacterized protein n=1 Tax=Pseudanabaena frigida TaxID=945775 RepID=A0A2W4Y0G9_9CYAN|nr:MAG: hypothetical protein DCF19_11320 [Pseudanabaena frigida]
MLALFLLSEAVTLYAPMTAAATQQQQAVVFPKNQNSITSAPTLSADDRVSKVSNSGKPAIAQCAPDNFQSFFEQFVRNPAERYDYIGAEVQVRDYQDPRRLLMAIGDRNYIDFRIWAIGNQYVYIDPSGKYRGEAELLKERLKLDYQRLDAKTFRVNYIRAEFIDDRKDRDGTLVRTYGEPEAYIFEHRDGCWHLTQSLRQYEYWKQSQTNEAFTYTPRAFRVINSKIYPPVLIGSDDAIYVRDRILNAYTDLIYYKKLDAQFGYRIVDKRNCWRKWNVIREAVDREFGFLGGLQCSGKYFLTQRLPDYDDSSGTYTSQSLDRIATAIVEYQASQDAIKLSPEALKTRWLEIRKKISIDTNTACVMAGG